jgi:hypothetical protein
VTTPAEQLERLRAYPNQGKAAYKARLLCAQHGLQVPPWAERKRPERPAARSMPRQRPAEHAPAQPVELPPELRAWREQHSGSIVSVGHAGVTLYPFCAEPLRFPDVSAALAAIATSQPERARPLT